VQSSEGTRHLSLFLLFCSFSLSKPLGIVPRAPTTIGITFVFTFHNILSSVAKSWYLVYTVYFFLLLLIHSGIHWHGDICQERCLFVSMTVMSGHPCSVTWSVCVFISQRIFTFFVTFPDLLQQQNRIKSFTTTEIRFDQKTSLVTTSAWPSSVKSSNYRRFKSDCGERSRDCTLLQNSHRPTASPCCGPTCCSLLFFSTSTKPQALNIVLSKALLQRRLIGVKGVEEGDRISPLEGYWQLLNRKVDSLGSPVINVARLPISWTRWIAQWFHVSLPPVSMATA